MDLCFEKNNLHAEFISDKRVPADAQHVFNFSIKLNGKREKKNDQY